MKTNEAKLLSQIKQGTTEIKRRINDPGEALRMDELKTLAKAWQRRLLPEFEARKIAAKCPLRSMAKSTPSYVRKFLSANQG